MHLSCPADSKQHLLLLNHLRLNPDMPNDAGKQQLCLSVKVLLVCILLEHKQHADESCDKLRHLGSGVFDLFKGSFTLLHTCCTLVARLLHTCCKTQCSVTRQSRKSGNG